MTSRKSSILKPGRVREPLQDLSQLIPNNDEEETTTTDNPKRRVSFACVNKIKEFEAGAECTTLLHTPAYDERFSISSDSYQSSFGDNSHDKSMFNSNIEICTAKSLNLLNRSKLNDENIEVVEVDIFNVSRGAPSPGKMSVGDSSMDMTNIIVPQGIDYETETETCYPLNLTKSFMSTQPITQSQDCDEDALDSSSMETTEALPCLITETIGASFHSSIYTQEGETRVEEQILFDFVDEASPSRKSEILHRENPTPKRLSTEMIDPEELDIMPAKRRSLTNESCSDESNANIELIPSNDRRKSLLPQSHADNQSIKSLVIREEKSTIINIDNAHHKAEIQQIKNVNVDIEYNKTHCENELIKGDDENQKIENEAENRKNSTMNLNDLRELQSSPKFNQENELAQETLPIVKNSVECISQNIPEPEPKKSPEDDFQPKKETYIPVARRKSSIPIAILTKKTPALATSFNLSSNDYKGLDDTSCNKNISVNDTNNVTKDMELTTAFQKLSQEFHIKSASPNKTNDAAKDMELTTALQKTTQEIYLKSASPNKTNDATGDMELTSAFPKTTQEIHINRSSPNKTNDATDDMELTSAYHKTTQEMIAKSVFPNKTNNVTDDMELTSAFEKTSQEMIVKSVLPNKTNNVTDDMELTSAFPKASQEIQLNSTTTNETSDTAKDMELTTALQKTTHEIRLNTASPNKTNDAAKDMELTTALQKATPEINAQNVLPSKTIDSASDMELTPAFQKSTLEMTVKNASQNEVNDATKNIEVAPAFQEIKQEHTHNISLDKTNDAIKEIDTTTAPKVIPITSTELVSINDMNNADNDMEITSAVVEGVEELVSIVCSQNDNKSDQMNILPVEGIGSSEIITNDSELFERSVGGCENTSSMIAECDIDDVMSNLKAVNITGDLTMCISQEENVVINQEVSEPSLEIIKNASAEIIQVVESSEENEQSSASEDIVEVSKLESPLFREERLQIAENIKKLLKSEMSHWCIKSMIADEWIFDALWNRLQLKILFDDCENSCTANLKFIPKEPTIEDEILRNRAAQGDEVLKIAAGPIIRKYKPKLDLLCSKIKDVVHLLKILSPDIIFAQKFAESFTYTIQTEDIELSKGKATFYVSSFEHRQLVRIEVHFKMLERLSLSSINVTQMIGNVDVNLIHDTFCEAGRDFNFFSLFVKNLREKIGN